MSKAMQALEKRHREAMQAQDKRHLQILAKNARETHERVLAAEARTKEIGKKILEAILRTAQEALQEDERERIVERAMTKFNEQRRLTAQEHKVLVWEMQNRELLRYAIARGLLPKSPPQPKQPRRRLNGQKPLKALPRPRDCP